MSQPKTTAGREMTNAGNVSPSEKSPPASSELLTDQNLSDLLISATPDALIALSPEGKVLYWNPGAECTFGYSPQEAIGRSLLDLTVPAGQTEEFATAMREILSAGAKVYEGLRRKKDGSLINVDISAKAILDEGGNVRFIALSQKDVTQLKALRDSQLLRERFRELLESVPDAIVMVNNLGRIVFVNSHAERMFGYDVEEMLGKPVEILLPQRYRESHRGHRTGYFPEPRTRPMDAGLELYGIRKDGVEFPAEISLSPLVTDEGFVAISAIRDITERKRANQARFQLAAIVESSEDAIIGKTLDGVVVSWNKGAERIFGYSADEAQGRSISLIAPPSRAGESREILQRIKNGERVERFETVRLTKDQKEIQVSLTVSPIRDQAGGIVGASTIERDITERKRLDAGLTALRDELKRQTIELQSANKELESFTYSVSHDLRAPIRHIQAFAELLNDCAANLDETNRHYLQNILDSTYRMGELIDDLLVLSRVGKTEMQVTPVVLNVVVQDVLKDLSGEIQSRSVAFKVDSLPTIDGDRALLRAMFTNLISNAVKFTRRSENPRIEIGSMSGAENETVIFVRDNGVGFDMQYADKLFGTFQRLHSSEEFEGTGIGLASVQRTVHRHGGRVWAEGKPGEGATFYFSLPQTRKED